jgi:hypothetical protein
MAGLAWYLPLALVALCLLGGREMHGEPLVGVGIVNASTAHDRVCRLGHV